MASRERKAEGTRWAGVRRAIVSGLALMIASVPVWADNDPEELGHHWDVPAYVGELRLQLAAMAVLTCVIVAGMYVAKARRTKGAHK